MALRLSLVSGQRQSPRRAVAFLEDDADSSKDGAAAFVSLQPNQERQVRERFDYWIDFGKKDTWFHGWPNQPDYKKCFTFKWKQKKVHQRLYGFLCHPKNREQAFQLCVLIYHATKNTDSTDFTILDRINILREMWAVWIAIQEIYPRDPGRN
jgi:hypothetical protein